jgi:hypothetical protein
MRNICVLVIAASCLTASGAEIDFAHKIAPVLKQHCGKCHSGSQQEGGLSMNTRESLLAGGESGATVVVGKSRNSELYLRITAKDEATRMPPEGDPLTAEQIGLLARWIDAGLPWEAGFSLGPQIYEPRLRPRTVELPPAMRGHNNPIDRILDTYLASQKQAPPPALSDEAFLRRASLDLIGLLPTPAERMTFLRDPSPDKRSQLVRALLARDVDYAEHWLTFWNDLLRNDYAGTGFITGGRKQISKWLYTALVTNKPYDEFTRELVAPPTPESSGFADGIRWRGEVSAGQTVEIQFAQSVGQTFLGINLKCASCHDSFIDRWKLEDAYGLAAIYSQRPMELHRCDKPTGKTATPAWLFSELGHIDPQASQPERLRQLAALLTHRENGRFTRTIVNRLWQRLMGRGIVHPTDAMQTQPWNEDLLDFLAEHLAENNYDLKQTLELIATSQAYQSQAERVTEDTDARGYRYAGPRAKRLTAEQFVDAVWQLTETAPQKIDAPIVRGIGNSQPRETLPVGKWIWTKADAGNIAAGETIALRRIWELPSIPRQAWAVVSCDNEYTLYVNGTRVHAGENWEQPARVSFANLREGENEILVVAKNGGSGPNPAGFFFEARWLNADEKAASLSSDATWQWTSQLPDKIGKYARIPEDWRPAAIVTGQQIWMARLENNLGDLLSQQKATEPKMVRASLLKSDFLMRSLGRPNRDQIVTVRPLELTTLEAIDLSNGEELAALLRQGAAKLQQRSWQSPREFIEWLYAFALSREPTAAELQTLSDVVGPELSAAAIEDILWAVVMLPEFQLVR